MVARHRSDRAQKNYIKYNKDTVTAFAKAEPDKDPTTDKIAEAITDDANDSPLPNTP
jgi:hypothetical protein